MKKFILWVGLFMASGLCGMGWYLVYGGDVALVSILALYCATIVLLMGWLQAL